MKIIKTCILIIIIFNVIEVNSKTIWDIKIPNQNIQTPILEETITPLKYKKNNIERIKVKINIPKEVEQEELIISPKLFESLSQYKNITKGDKTNIDLIIENNSNYDYYYVDNSLIISTNNLSLSKDINNYKDTNAIGFDNNKIYEIFTPKRTFNSALKSLYNYTSTTEQKNTKLTTKSIEERLKNIGYNSIENLDDYYLDYYNNKYQMNITNLNDFPYFIIKEIFTGIKTNQHETNSEIISLSYNYFYNKLLSITFNNKTITDSTSQNYSIGEHMRRNIGNNYFKKAFFLIKSNTTNKLEDISININDVYTTEIYENYIYSAHLEFKLKKIAK